MCKLVVLLLIALLLVLATTGCASSRELWESEYAQKVAREATQEAVIQVGELIEAKFGFPMPDSFRDQITDVLLKEINKAMDNLLQDAEVREKATKDEE